MELDKNNKIEKVQIDGKKISIGLDWDVLKGTMSQSKEISILLKQQGNLDVKKGIIIKTSESIVYTGVGFIHGKDKLYGKSGAAWLSDAYKQNLKKIAKLKKEKLIEVKEEDEDFDEESPAWVVIEKLENENDKYWVTIIKDGLPLPGTDIVESFYSVVDRINDFFSVAKDVEVYAKDLAILEEIELASSMVTGECNVYQKSFGEIVNKVRCTKTATTLTGVDPKLLVVGAIAIAGFAGYYFWSSYQDDQVQKAAQQKLLLDKHAKQEESLKVQKNYEDLKSKVLAQTVVKAKNDLNSVLTTQTAPEIIDAWVNLLNQIKLSHAGWNMDSINCGIESGVPQCVVSLDRGDIGINRSLLQDFPTAIINGDTAVYLLKSAPLEPHRGDFTALPDAKDFTVNMLSNLELLKFGDIKHAVDASQEVTQSVNLPDPPTGITQDMNVSPIKMGVSFGNIHLQGTDIWQLKGLSPILESNGLTVQKLSITIDNTYKSSNWKMDGVYYVKTGNVVIPTIPPSKIAGIN